MPQIYANNATSTLSTAIGTGDTSIFIQPSHGARFPVISGGDFAYCTLEDASGNIEIVKVTAHAASATSLTVVRAQQGTAARAWASGDLFELRFTAVEATAWETDIDALQSTRAQKAGDTYTGTHNMTGAVLAVATPAAANQAVPKSYADAIQAYADGLAFAAALPSMTGNAGKWIYTDGTNAYWVAAPFAPLTGAAFTGPISSTGAISSDSNVVGLKVGANVASPAATLDVGGNQASNVVAMAALDVDCSAGTYFTKSINGASTFTFSGVPASRAFGFTLELTHTSGVVTWPASVKWPNDVTPTLTTGKTHLFVFITDDGGTRWRGAAQINYVN